MTNRFLPSGMLRHHRNRKIHFREPLTFLGNHKIREGPIGVDERVIEATEFELLFLCQRR